jgi:hypothetical protein
VPAHQQPEASQTCNISNLRIPIAQQWAVAGLVVGLGTGQLFALISFYTGHSQLGPVQSPSVGEQMPSLDMSGGRICCAPTCTALELVMLCPSSQFSRPD